MLIVALWTDETPAQQSIIPIKDDSGLMKLWLLKRSKPDFLISQFTEEVPSNVIISSIL
jgi:hypothetical protein